MIGRSITFTAFLASVALLSACQTVVPVPVAEEAPPQVESIVPNLRITLVHGACAGPPCPVGMAEDLGSGERVTIYDYDLTPLGLSAVDRMRMTQTLFADVHLVKGAIEQRVGFLGVDRPIEVLIVDAVVGPA